MQLLKSFLDHTCLETSRDTTESEQDLSLTPFVAGDTRTSSVLDSCKCTEHDGVNGDGL